MTVPKAKFQKTDGQTGALAPSGVGMLVIIAPAQQGTQNELGTYGSPDALLQQFGDGPLTQVGAYVMAVSKALGLGNAVACIRPTTTTPGAYGAFTNTGAGTSTPAAGVTLPLDDYDVVINFIAGGALGTAGITYQVSLDGGVTFGPVLALGTALNIVIANTGITVVLGTAAETVLAGQSCTFSVTGPRMTDADIAAAQTALSATQIAWEGVLVVNLAADATAVTSFDTFLSGLEASRGLFKFFLLNTIRKTAAQTEAQYLTALQTVVAGMASIRGCVCADGATITNLGGSVGLRNLNVARDTAVALAARAMAIDIAEDPAFIGRGSLQGVEINNAKGAPVFHDEQTYPGLDDLNLTTLRNVDGEVGTFINNARVISPAGSDYVYLQHIRVMNRACEVGTQRLRKLLSKSVKRDPNTGFMLAEDRAAIELDVSETIKTELKGRVSAVAFTLSTNDDLSSNSGSTVTGELQLDALAYIKGFLINAHFVRTLTGASAP